MLMLALGLEGMLSSSPGCLPAAEAHLLNSPFRECATLRLNTPNQASLASFYWVYEETILYY